MAMSIYLVPNFKKKMSNNDLTKFISNKFNELKIIHSEIDKIRKIFPYILIPVKKEMSGQGIHFWFDENFIKENWVKLYLLITQLITEEKLSCVLGNFSFVINNSFVYINIFTSEPNLLKEAWGITLNVPKLKYYHKTNNNIFFINEVISPVISENNHSKEFYKAITISSLDDNSEGDYELIGTVFEKGCKMILVPQRQVPFRMVLQVNDSLAIGMKQINDELVKFGLKIKKEISSRDIFLNDQKIVK